MGVEGAAAFLEEGPLSELTEGALCPSETGQTPGTWKQHHGNNTAGGGDWGRTIKAGGSHKIRK